MYKIVKKQKLNDLVTRMDIFAPSIAFNAKPGQFIILRVNEFGERIPLTIADSNVEHGTVSIIFQIVGKTTSILNRLNEGEYILDFVGPLGTPSDLEGIKKAAIIGGGLGVAISFPQAKALNKVGAEVHSVCGFRNKELIILEDEVKSISNKTIILTDDGSNGNKGFVTDALKKLIEDGNSYDTVIAIGPLQMMKAVCNLTKNYNIKTIVSMNPIMIDGTGMCGVCRVTVDGKIKFACVDGPDFNGHLVDFDEAIKRNRVFDLEEGLSRDSNCKLMKRGVE